MKFALATGQDGVATGIFRLPLWPRSAANHNVTARTELAPSPAAGGTVPSAVSAPPTTIIRGDIVSYQFIDVTNSGHVTRVILNRPEVLNAIKGAGIFVISSATTVAEARILEERGVDAIIAQGTEAGGHRGTFTGTDLCNPACSPYCRR